MTRMSRKKLVVVGDGGCGKTSLLVVYQKKEFPTRYVPTVFENYIAEVQLENNRKVELALWDTAGQEDYDRLRPLSYPETDVVLICFAINQPTSFYNVQDRWLPEVTHFCEKVPKLLVGTKMDLRQDGPDGAQEEAFSVPGKSGGDKLIPYDEGVKLSREIGAKGYYECSARDNNGVTEVIEAATRAALENNGLLQLRKKLCAIL